MSSPCQNFSTSALIAWLLLATTLCLSAQPPPAAPARDPLMSLMISQPKLTIPAVTRAAAVFDPPIVRPGEEAFLRVMFNALEESIEWPAQITAPPQLELRPGARSQVLQVSPTNMEPRTAFNTRVRPSSVGSFTVPAFVVKVDGKPVTVPAARLEVASATPPSLPPAQRLQLDLPVTNLIVGQAVLARVTLPPARGNVVQGLVQPQLTGQGFLVDVGTARQRIEMTHRDGAAVPTFIYETTLTPLTTGKLTLFAQGFTAGNQFGGPFIITGPAVIPGGPPHYNLLESDPVHLEVRPLPREGELPGFTGAIGSFAVGPPALAANVLRVGDPVKLTVAVTNRSGAPLARIVPPPPPKARDWHVFAAADFALAQPVGSPPPGSPIPVGPSARPGAFQGVVTFHYTLIPLTETARATPPIPFSCYDPEAGRYANLTIPSVPVAVKPGAVPGDFASFLQAGAAEGKPEKELTLSSLAASRGRSVASLVPLQQQAWFPLVALAPAVAFLGLWNWDRRRRYLEAHPDVLLRRRARRALRREQRALRRAARAADAPRFAAVAVSAIRVACAPHYPAEPRALVGADVLPLLPEADRAGRSGEVVRRIFAVTDASRFGAANAPAPELLLLQPDLERVLEQLEARL
ncbi:MAG TPA: BatD family protein [Candidatus Paceibacterota bacterium]|nr:BatD family protein [Verrucomicrobiota bacterium]HSA09367.1 BatD family protein [Candidatus Paceibacterota bacterium]